LPEPFSRYGKKENVARKISHKRANTMTDERREANRLRSERWRRAHGIGPRKPSSEPWLDAGCSRSTYYRRRAKARQQAAMTESFDRAEAFTRQLQRELVTAAGFMTAAGSILREFPLSKVVA
jgi:hypothetical protein